MTASELSRFWQHLQQPVALTEIAILLGCLGLAWLIVRLWRGRQGDVRSIWLGHHVIDGALFPVLSLGLALLAYRLFQGTLPMRVFQVAIPVLTSLAVIRITVKVLRVVFPESRTMRVIERTVSWVAWLAMVLWVTGLLPIVLAGMESVTWKVGGSVINLRDLIEGAITAVLVLILSLSLSSAIEAQLLKGATSNLSLRKMAVNALRSVLLLVGLMLALSTAGIDLTALSVFGGAIGVGLGFGLQKLAANYVSGFVILAERSLRIGDLVKGVKDGQPEEVLIYNVCDHEACYQEVGSQAISYTAGVPAVAAALLIANGTWDVGQMVNVEELDPQPFIALMNTMGIVSRIRDRDGDRLLDPAPPLSRAQRPLRRAQAR